MTKGLTQALIVGAIGLLAGLCIGWVDTRPGWDDTGVSALGIVLVAGALGVVRPILFLVSGLAVGLPVLLLGLIVQDNAESALAVVVALIASALGALLGRFLGFGSRVTA